MQLTQLPDPAKFNLRTVALPDGNSGYLITPKPEFNNGEWATADLIFRSSLWDNGLNLISAGFPKFFNLGQNPTTYPNPDIYMDWEAVEKIDGSLLVVSYLGRHPIIRTRGSDDAEHMENSHELEYLREKYPAAFDNFMLQTGEYSFLYEWGSPNNQIVMRFDTPELYLIGIIRHSDYHLWAQADLDKIALAYNLKRPRYYPLNQFGLSGLAEEVSELVGQEGICLYFGSGQFIRKIKSKWYLLRHAFRSNLSIKNLLALFYELECPSYGEFLDYIEREYDWECRQAADPFVIDVCAAHDTLIAQYNAILHKIAKYKASGHTYREWVDWVKELENPYLQNYAFLSWKGAVRNDEREKRYLLEKLKGE